MFFLSDVNSIEFREKRNTKVKSYVRKGRVVRSYDKKIDVKKALITGGIGALGVGALTGAYLLSKGKVKPNVIGKQVNNVSTVIEQQRIPKVNITTVNEVAKQPMTKVELPVNDIVKPSEEIVDEIDDVVADVVKVNKTKPNITRRKSKVNVTKKKIDVTTKGRKRIKKKNTNTNNTNDIADIADKIKPARRRKNVSDSGITRRKGKTKRKVINKSKVSEPDITPNPVIEKKVKPVIEKKDIKYQERVARGVKPKTHKFQNIITSKTSKPLSEKFNKNLAKRSTDELNLAVKEVDNRIEELTKLSKSDKKVIGGWGKGRIDKLIHRFERINTKLKTELDSRNQIKKKIIEKPLNYLDHQAHKLGDLELAAQKAAAKVAARRATSNLSGKIVTTGKLSGRAKGRILKVKKQLEKVKVTRRDVLKAGFINALLNPKTRTIIPKTPKQTTFISDEFAAQIAGKPVVNPTPVVRPGRSGVLKGVYKDIKKAKTDTTETKKLYDIINNMDSRHISRRTFLDDVVVKNAIDWIKRDPIKFIKQGGNSALDLLKALADPTGYAVDKLTPAKLDKLSKIILAISDVTGLYNSNIETTNFNSFFLSDFNYV